MRFRDTVKTSRKLLHSWDMAGIGKEGATFDRLGHYLLD